jgi:mono/diheme cytochrome c family protein
MKRAHGLALAACAALAAAPGARPRRRGADGQQIFVRWCVPLPRRGPGTGTKLQKYRHRRRPRERSDLTAEVVKYYVRHGISVMAPFRKTEISDEELAALASWLTRPRAAAQVTP